VFSSKLTAPPRFKASLGITGKYVALRDAYASIDKAIEHSAVQLATDLDVRWIDTSEGSPEEIVAKLEGLDAVIVPGGFGHRGTEGKIACVEYCYEHRLPYLGICLGFQMAVVMFARKICGLKGAGSTEFEPDVVTPVIDILPEQKLIEGLGGNMRLGGKDVLVNMGTLADFLLRDDAIAGSVDTKKQSFLVRRRFRHRYEVDPTYIPVLEEHGLVFSGRHTTQPIMQILELPQEQHPYFIGAQFHPELTSRPLRPAPLFMGLVAAAVRHAHPQVTPEELSARWLRPELSAATV
jgi:CTP synthase